MSAPHTTPEPAASAAIDAARAEGLPELHAHGGLSAEWTTRYTDVLMNNFGPPKQIGRASCRERVSSPV